MHSTDPTRNSGSQRSASTERAGSPTPSPERVFSETPYQWEPHGIDISDHPASEDAAARSRWVEGQRELAESLTQEMWAVLPEVNITAGRHGQLVATYNGSGQVAGLFSLSRESPTLAAWLAGTLAGSAAAAPSPLARALASVGPYIAFPLPVRCSGHGAGHLNPITPSRLPDAQRHAWIGAEAYRAGVAEREGRDYRPAVTLRTMTDAGGGHRIAEPRLDVLRTKWPDRGWGPSGRKAAFPPSFSRPPPERFWTTTPRTSTSTTSEIDQPPYAM